MEVASHHSPPGNSRRVEILSSKRRRTVETQPSRDEDRREKNRHQADRERPYRSEQREGVNSPRSFRRRHEGHHGPPRQQSNSSYSRRPWQNPSRRVVLETPSQSHPEVAGAETPQPGRSSVAPTPETIKFHKDSKELWNDIASGRGPLPKKVKPNTAEAKEVQPKYVDSALNIAEAHGLPVPARPPSENRRADIRKTPNLAASIRKIQAETLTEQERLQKETQDLFEKLARERGIDLAELLKITPQTSVGKPKPPDVRCIIPGAERTPVDDNFELLDYDEEQGPFISESELPPTPGKESERQIQTAILSKAAEKLKNFVEKQKEKSLKQKSLKTKILVVASDVLAKKSPKGKALVTKEKPILVIEKAVSIAQVTPTCRDPQPQPGPSNK